MRTETEDLTRRVLDSFEAPPTYSPDLSYEVSRRIMRCPEWWQEYEALGEEGTVNQWIGKAVRALVPPRIANADSCSGNGGIDENVRP